jgi:uncharacterized protein
LRKPPEHGERDLGRLLAGLDPHLEARPRVIVRLPEADAGSWLGEALAVVRETEATTLVLDAEAAKRAGLPAVATWAQITLRVYSDLEAVGLVAAVSTRLAAHGISVNALAGFHHDHLLVPWERREEALGALSELAREWRERSRR